MKSCVKMLISHKFCHNVLVFKRKKIFIIFSLLFFAGVVKCICKSVVQTTISETAHHFPPYHIGKRPGTLRSRAFILQDDLAASKVCFRTLEILFRAFTRLSLGAVWCVFAHLKYSYVHSL